MLEHTDPAVSPSSCVPCKQRSLVDQGIEGAVMRWADRQIDVQCIEVKGWCRKALPGHGERFHSFVHSFGRWQALFGRGGGKASPLPNFAPVDVESVKKIDSGVSWYAP